MAFPAGFRLTPRWSDVIQLQLGPALQAMLSTLKQEWKCVLYTYISPTCSSPLTFSAHNLRRISRFH
jgi:hypothetical protein